MAVVTDLRQQHFVIYELVIPYCTVCTPRKGVSGKWHTPVTCEEDSDAEYSLFFTTQTAPSFIKQPNRAINGVSRLNSVIHRCVSSGSESTAQLKAGEGLASRGAMSITMTDFAGDPGPIEFSEKGTFFGKLKARNVLIGKKIISHYMTVAGAQGSERFVKVSESIHYVTDANLSKGQFKLSGKDALKDIERFGDKFPPVSNVTLSSDIDEAVTTIAVNDASKLVAGGVIRIDDELIRIKSKSGNTLTTEARGATLTGVGGEVVYKTNKSDHSAGATVQPCYLMNKTPLANVLADIYSTLDMGSFVDLKQWQDEIGEWNAGADLYGVFSKPESGDDLVNRLLSAYMVDQWLDQPTQKIKTSTVSVWKEATTRLEEGNDFSNLTITETESKRYSRAMMYHRKDYKAEGDDITNYSVLTLRSDLEKETSDFYGAPRLKEFDNNDFITTGAATAMLNRFIQRYSSSPRTIKFTMEERKTANVHLGRVVDIVSRDHQDFNGEIQTRVDRAQVIKVQPILNKVGRQYDVTCLTYVPLIATDPEQELVITLTGTVLTGIDLFAEAGYPNQAINVTFIFKSMTIGCNFYNIPSVRCGDFPAGSRIRIICTEGTKWSARGGDAVSSFYESRNYQNIYEVTTKSADGGDSFSSDGVTAEIYLSGTHHGYSADGYLYSSGGAGAVPGMDYQTRFGEAPAGGGSGIPAGSSGYWKSIYNNNGIYIVLNEFTASPEPSFSSGGGGVYNPTRLCGWIWR